MEQVRCKHCQSDNLYLEPKVAGQDPMTADMVALKCGNCNKWLKWVKKDERHLYSKKKQEQKKVIKEPKEQPTETNGFNYDTIKALLELRKEFSKHTTFYRALVLGTIDDKIKELRTKNK